jgi:hypothetical protein
LRFSSIGLGGQVVLSANLLDDIRNVRCVELVVAASRRHQPAELRR